MTLTARHARELIVHGRWPRQSIDHIDGNRMNNRLENLRDVSHIDNMGNQRKARINNRSGFLGVSREGTRFRAVICLDGKQKYLGAFATAEEAYRTYIQAKRKLHKCCTI